MYFYEYIYLTGKIYISAYGFIIRRFNSKLILRKKFFDLSKAFIYI